MKLHILFGQRTQSYDGAAAPVAPREVKMWRTRAARSQETAHDE